MRRNNEKKPKSDRNPKDASSSTRSLPMQPTEKRCSSRRNARCRHFVSARGREELLHRAPPLSACAAWLTMEGLQLQGEMHDVRSRNKTAIPPQMLPERVIRPESPRSSPLEDGQPRATVDKKRGRRSTDALPLYGLPDGVLPA